MGYENYQRRAPQREKLRRKSAKKKHTIRKLPQLCPLPREKMRKITKTVLLHHRQIIAIRYDIIYRIQISAHSVRENHAVSGNYPCITD